MSQDVTRLIAELVDAWNAHDVARVAGFHAADYEGVDVGEPGRQLGPQGIGQTMARYLRAFPDLCLTGEATVIEGNRVALGWKARGTHQGPLMNIPPTGRAVEVRGVTLLTVEGSKVRRGLYVWDVAGLLRALGLLPDL
ncbi:MAG: ester cyclase [Chloroflexi bacterium]|nr:ester cyclase [Chloroflexota bacterium]